MTNKQFEKLFNIDRQVRDGLGFTFDDYENMQAMRARKGLQGDTLLDGYDVTKEQIQAINEKDRFAIDMFFYVNERRIRRLAYCFLRRFPQLALWLTVDDCINQAYLDMRRGFLFFEYKPKYISALLCHSFYYASVGGFGDEDGVFKYRPRFSVNAVTAGGAV